MLFPSLRIAGAALIAAATLVPSMANAQYYGGAPAPYYAGDYGRGGYDRSGYDDRRGYDDRDGRHRHAYYRHRDRCDRCSTGTILGAIAGGLLGNAAIGRHGSHTAGTLVGAGAGALVGNAVDRNC